MDTKEKRLAEFFKVLSDQTRIRILYILMSNEFCVNDLAEKLGMTQSAVSHQLRVLRDSGLIAVKRRGKQKLYSMPNKHIKNIIMECEIYSLPR